MKHTRFLSAILAALLSLSTLACAADPADDSADTTAADTTAEATTVAETEEYTDPGAKYDNKTVTVASYFCEGGDWEIWKYHVALKEENADIINDAIVNRNRTVEEELGVVLELFPLANSDRNDSSKIRNLITAGEDAYHFAMTMAGGIAPMLNTENMLVDLNTIDTMDLSHTWWNQNANDEYTIYGKQLAAVGDICFFNLVSPVVTYFSKEMIKANNLEDPYALVDSGAWTLDKMIEMSTTVSRDLNGDGVMRDADVFGLFAETASVGYFVIASDIRLSTKDEKGNITLAINSERTVDLMDRLVPFFNNDNIIRMNSRTELQYTSAFRDYAIPKLNANELLFFTHQILTAIDMRVNESDFGIIPLPKFDDEQETYISIGNTAFSDHLIVPITNMELDMTGHVIEAMGYYAQKEITPAVVERSIKTKSVRDEKAVEMLDLVMKNQTFDLAYIFDWGKCCYFLRGMAKGQNFTTEYAKIETAAKTALADTLAQMQGE